MNPPNTAIQTRERTVIYAKLFADLLQTREHGGNNRGEVVETLLRKEGGSAGMPWCMAFAATLYEFACKSFGLTPDIDLNLSVSDGVHKARLLGRYHEDVNQVRPGDLVVIKGGPSGYQHVGIAISFANQQGEVATIEGNTNVAGGADGDGVYRKKRSGAGIGFISL